MRWRYALRARAAAWLRPGARDRETEAEIAHHLRAEAERLERAGLTPDDAARMAVERFGDPIAIAESTRTARGGRALEGSMQDVAYAWRALRTHWRFTVIALVTLALGIGATTAAFAVLDTVVLRPLPYRDADRLVFLQEVTDRHTLNPPSYPNFADWRDRAASFERVASAMFPSSATVRASASDDAERIVWMGVSRRFFHTLGVALAAGREFTDAEAAPGGPQVVMVSYEFWQSQLHGRMPLGTIVFGGDPVEVVGVTPPHFQFITAADVFLAHDRFPGTCRTCRNYMVVGRLRPGATIASARTEMTTLAAAMKTQYGDDTAAAGVEVTDLREYVVGDYRSLLGIVFGAAALVLLVACTNLLTAQLARGWIREREMLVRASLGASRSRLVRQLLVEHALLVAAGTLAGVGVAAALTRLVATVGAGQLPRLQDLAIDGRILLFAIAASVVTVVGAGLGPALRLSRPAAAGALRSTRGTATTIRTSWWRVLAGFEVALAVALSVGSILLVRTVNNIMHADAGFDPRGLLTASITPSEHDAAHLEDAREALAALPGVEGVAYTTRLPLSWGANSGPVRRRTDPMGPTWPAMAGFRMVSSGYFDVVKQPVLRGRAFSPADGAHAPLVAIVTPGIASALWPGEDPVGKTIATNYLTDEWLTVVGVVAEASNWAQPKGRQNEIFVPYVQHLHALPGQNQIVAMIRTSTSPDALTSPVRASLRHSLPESAATFWTMEDRIARTAADRRFAMAAVTGFAAIALVLAAVGIYGVFGYVVATQSRDIGVRLALGATPGLVRRGVLEGAAAIAGIGCGAGAIAALAASRYLQASLFGVSRQDPATYAASITVVTTAVLLGAWVPARRASAVDPLVAMRVE